MSLCFEVCYTYIYQLYMIHFKWVLLVKFQNDYPESWTSQSRMATVAGQTVSNKMVTTEMSSRGGWSGTVPCPSPPYFSPQPQGLSSFLLWVVLWTVTKETLFSMTVKPFCPILISNHQHPCRICLFMTSGEASWIPRPATSPTVPSPFSPSGGWHNLWSRKKDNYCWYIYMYILTG